MTKCFEVTMKRETHSNNNRCIYSNDNKVIFDYVDHVLFKIINIGDFIAIDNLGNIVNVISKRDRILMTRLSYCKEFDCIDVGTS